MKFSQRIKKNPDRVNETGSPLLPLKHSDETRESFGGLTRNMDP